MRLLPQVISSHHNLIHNYYPFTFVEYLNENAAYPKSWLFDPLNNYKNQDVFWTEIYFANKLCSDFLDGLGV